MTEKKPRMSISAVEGAPPPATISPPPINIPLTSDNNQPEKRKSIFGKLFQKSIKGEKNVSIMGRGNTVNPVTTESGMSRKDTVTSITESEADVFNFP
uniref:PEST proteolytic signal-containing nuclear protein n=1 Tax=Parastrongyloides trichosuri TaxID=131310 RepID=A0A0N4ZC08_PARTI